MRGGHRIATGAPDERRSGVAPSAGANIVLPGQVLAPGLARARVWDPRAETRSVLPRRVGLTQLEEELNLLQRIVLDVRRDTEQLMARTRGRLSPGRYRRLELHAASFKDSVFTSEVEGMILGERLALESAVAKVLADGERIRRLFPDQDSSTCLAAPSRLGVRILSELRHAALDLDCQDAEQEGFVLVAEHLDVSDLLGFGPRRVAAILLAGTSRDADLVALVRVLGLPALGQIDGLMQTLETGVQVEVDGQRGWVLAAGVSPGA